jgi:hypothetical protein
MLSQSLTAARYIKGASMADESKDIKKKQIPLRLSPDLFAKLSRWAEDDFRSVNGQIEYILSEAVKKRYMTKESE